MKNGPYNLVIAPENYPGKKYREKYAYEHHVVYWENTGKIPVKGKTEVHHKDENKRHNIFSNLEMLDSSKHKRLHNLGSGEGSMDLVCYFCKIIFQKEVSYVNFKRNIGQDRFFCCRSHQVKQQWIDNPNKRY